MHLHNPVPSEDSIAPPIPGTQVSTALGSPIPTSDIVGSPWRNRILSSASQRPPLIHTSSSVNQNSNALTQSSTEESLASTISSSAAAQQSNRMSTLSNGMVTPTRSSIVSFVLPIPQKFTNVTPITEELSDDSGEIIGVSKPSKASSLVRIGLGGNPAAPITNGLRRPSQLQVDINPNAAAAVALTTIVEKAVYTIPEESQDLKSVSSLSSFAPTIKMSNNSNRDLGDLEDSEISPSIRRPHPNYSHNALSTGPLSSSPSFSSDDLSRNGESPVEGDHQTHPPLMSPKPQILPSSRTARARENSILKSSSPLRMATSSETTSDYNEVFPENSTNSVALGSNQSSNSITKSTGRSSVTGRTVQKSSRTN